MKSLMRSPFGGLGVNGLGYCLMRRIEVPGGEDIIERPYLVKPA
jgi:hypothetical protein